MKKKIVFLGGKKIGVQCLQFLQSQTETLDFEIVEVITTENKKDLELILQREDIDFLFSVQYHQILKKEHLEKVKTIAVNLHMAPLPEYRGCNQFTFAILDGKKDFGVTLHEMDARIDHGDILFESRFLIPENCFVDELYALAEKESLTLFKASLPKILSGNFEKISQENLITEKGMSLHYRDEINDVKKIDLNWPAEKIERHVRATSMPGFEPPYAIVNGEKFYLAPEKTKGES